MPKLKYNEVTVRFEVPSYTGIHFHPAFRDRLQRALDQALKSILHEEFVLRTWQDFRSEEDLRIQQRMTSLRQKNAKTASVSPNEGETTSGSSKEVASTAVPTPSVTNPAPAGDGQADTHAAKQLPLIETNNTNVAEEESLNSAPAAKATGATKAPSPKSSGSTPSTGSKDTPEVPTPTIPRT